MKQIPLFFLTFVIILLSGCGGEEQQVVVEDGAPKTVVAPSLNIHTLQDPKTITLKWNSQTGASEYRLYWNTTGDVTQADSMIVIDGELQYQHVDIESGVTYYYRVSALRENGEEGPLSLEASAKIQDVLAVVFEDAAE